MNAKHHPDVNNYFVEHPRGGVAVEKRLSVFA